MSDEAHSTTQHCLNCSAELSGRYCCKCGQDSQTHLDSVWHLVKHFFEDITHYDGKLWKTVRPLLTKPGFLTIEYLQGRRAGYLNPVRMFIFLNFVFFLLLLSLPFNSNKKQTIKASKGGISKELAADSSLNVVKIDKVASLTTNGNLSSSTEYDSVQRTLPLAQRDGRFVQMVNEKGLDLAQAAKKNPDYISEKITEVFFHNAAKLTFVFLIFCSFFLWLLYYRQHVPMVNHALFSIHIACTFLLLSVFMLLVNYVPLGDYIFLLLFLYGNYYLYRALRNVYRQRAAKTAVKFVIIYILLGTVISLALVVNALFALMSVS